MATPLPSAWAFQHLDMFFDLDNWRVSAQGNRYIRVDQFCITVFARPRSQWAWCIAGQAKHKPLWSTEGFGSERDARIDAWDALVSLAEAEGR